MDYGIAVFSRVIDLVSLETVIPVSLEQPQKASYPIFVTDGGMEMLVRQEQPSKAPLPISVTDGGMVILSRLE